MTQLQGWLFKNERADSMTGKGGCERKVMADWVVLTVKHWEHNNGKDLVA